MRLLQYPSVNRLCQVAIHCYHARSGRYAPLAPPRITVLSILPSSGPGTQFGWPMHLQCNMQYDIKHCARYGQATLTGSWHGVDKSSAGHANIRSMQGTQAWCAIPCMMQCFRLGAIIHHTRGVCLVDADKIVTTG